MAEWLIYTVCPAMVLDVWVKPTHFWPLCQAAGLAGGVAAGVPAVTAAETS